MHRLRPRPQQATRTEIGPCATRIYAPWKRRTRNHLHQSEGNQMSSFFWLWLLGQDKQVANTPYLVTVFKAVLCLGLILTVLVSVLWSAVCLWAWLQGAKDWQKYRNRGVCLNCAVGLHDDCVDPKCHCDIKVRKIK